MRALVTGAEGFVGGHLSELLAQHGYDVWGTVLEQYTGAKQWLTLDILAQEAIETVLTKVSPDIIFHLAGFSSVKDSWQKPASALEINVLGTAKLLEAVRKCQLDCRIILIGSAEEYGQINQAELPVKEHAPLLPLSPYGVSKASQSIMARQYVQGYGLNIVYARPFNHIGPRQALGFITADFAKQIADIELGLQEPVIKVGNLESYRDFTDVRDIVKAYLLLAEKGRSGEIYNICSGRATQMQEILDGFLALSSAKIKVEADPQRMRPSDLPVIVGDLQKITRDTGWQPEIPLKQSLQDILNYWRQQAAMNR